MAEIRLWDNETLKKVSLKTQPVKEDIDLYFPNTTGTLVTHNNLVQLLEEQNVNLTSTAIVKPKILTALLDGDTFDGILKVSEYKTTETYIGEHTDTEWQVSTDFDFSDIIDSSKIKVNKYTFSPKVEIPEVLFYIRCRFISDNMRSPWSEIRYFKSAPQGLRSIEILVKEDKLTPVIDIKPLETYGDMEVPDIKSLTFKVFEKGVEIYSVERDRFTLDKNIPVNILKPNTEYEISCNIKFINRNDEQTSLLYHSLNIYVEKPILEHYIENGRKYVKGTLFKSINYKDTHYKTEWEIFTEGNVSIYKDDSLTDLITLDVTDIIQPGTNYKVTCKYYGKESVVGGNYYTSEISEIDINPYKKIVNPLTCDIVENPDGSITINTNSYKITGEGVDEYFKTVVGFYKKAESNRLLLYQIDTADDLFNLQEHNINTNENVLNIPEHILGIVAREASSAGEYHPEIDVIVYKVGTSGDRTNSIIKTIKNRYDLKKISYKFINNMGRIVIVPPVTNDKVGNFKILSCTLIIRHGNTEVDRQVVLTDLTQECNLEFDITKLTNGVTYTGSIYVDTDKFTKKFDLLSTIQYDYKCKQPIINIKGQGLNKTIDIEFNGIDGLPKDGDNGEHYATDIKIYRTNGDLVAKWYSNSTDKTSYTIKPELLNYNTNYIVKTIVSTTKSPSPVKIDTLSINNVTVNLGGIKGAEGSVVVNKYPTLEIYNYNVIGANDYGTEHYATTWKILDENDLVIWKVEQDMNNLTRITARANLISGKDYTIKAIAHSRMYGDSTEVSSVISYSHSKIDIPVPDTLESLIFGNETGGIYGAVSNSLISGKRSYLGNWGNEFETRNISNSDVGSNVHFSYEIGNRVSYNHKLYECIKEHNWKISKAPDIGPTYWKEVNEDLLLPSFEELADSLGIAYNLQEPAFSANEVLTKFSYWSSSNPIGNLVTNNKWIKMLSPTTNRICYVTNKCLINQISYNDIVSRRKEYLMVDKYTLLFGTRLYYVRVTTEEEELLLQSLPVNQGVDMNSDVIVCNSNIDKTGTIKVVSNSKVGKSLASNRNCSFRIVITPIDISEAPFNLNRLNFPVNKAHGFVYDKYTDTGYYGFLTKEEFINLDEFFLEIGLNEGLDLSNTITKWFIYYEHGRILFRPNKPLKANIDFETLRKKGLVFGTNMGNYHIPTKYYYNKNNYKTLFTIELMDTCRFNIVDLTNREPNNKHYTSNADLYNKNIGLINTEHVNLLFRTLTPGYNCLGYGNLNVSNTAISGTIIGNSFTDGKTEVNKNIDLHIGTITKGYNLLYPYSIDVATKIVGKNIIIDAKPGGYLSRIGSLDTKNYMPDTLYSDDNNDKLGWLPILVLN